MKWSIAIILLLITCVSFISRGRARQNFDRSAYYSSIASGKLDRIDTQLEAVKNASFDNHEAFEGTLLMRKAGLVRKMKEKLDMFKDGRNKLESSIARDSAEVELRFLRLLIQENAPKVLKYQGELDRDRELIREKFKNLSPAAQKAVINYSKNSKILKPADF